MLISCKACAATNVVDGEAASRKDVRCLICRKQLTLPNSSDAGGRRSFRARADAITVRRPVFEDEPTPLVPTDAIREMLADSLAKVSVRPMWGKNDDGHTSPDPLMLASLEKKIRDLAETEARQMNVMLSEQLEATREVVVIEDEEDEDLSNEPPQDEQPAAEGKATFMAPTVPSIPAAKRIHAEKQRQIQRRAQDKWVMAAFLLVVGLGVGTTGAALANARESRSTSMNTARTVEPLAPRSTPILPAAPPAVPPPTAMAIVEVNAEDLPVSAPLPASESKTE